MKQEIAPESLMFFKIFAVLKGPFMWKKLVTIIFCFCLIIIEGCGIYEPAMGRLTIVFEQEAQGQNLTKSTGSLLWAQYRLKRGNELVRWEHLQKTGDVFHTLIADLEPANDYSIVLYGRMREFEIAASASQSGIEIKKGEETRVQLSWSPFTPVQITPVEGDTITGETLTFQWASVAESDLYQLDVAEDTLFLTPAISRPLHEQSCTVFKALFKGNAYYWRIRCRGLWNVSASTGISVQRWGKWSELRRFVLD
jgi:hypothetical protein